MPDELPDELGRDGAGGGTRRSVDCELALPRELDVLLQRLDAVAFAGMEHLVQASHILPQSRSSLLAQQNSLPW